MKREIKVLECIRQGLIGGGESHLLSLVENLDKTRFKPVVLSFTAGPMIDRLTNMNVSSHVIHTLRPFDVSKWRRVRDFIQEHQIDIVHAHGTRAASNVLWAAKSLNLPIIYTVHGWSFHQDQNYLVRNMRILGEKYITRNATLNISVSASNQESGRNYIKGFQSIVVNNGIDSKKFDPQRQLKDIRAEFNISKDKIVVLFIARFTSHKQPLSLIQAFAKALLHRNNLHLLMVGDGDQRIEAENLIRDLNVVKNATLVNFRQDVPDILGAADIYVLPSLWEGLPIGLLEAMRMGKAVIATNVDGTKEIIVNEMNGILIETNNLVPQLASAIVRLSADEALRSFFSKKAQQTVAEKFDAVAMTRQIESIYLQLTQNIS